MDTFDRATLRALAEHDSDVCISLFMQTMRNESDWAQNAIRYKNLLNAARDTMREQGHSDDEIESILGPARALADDTTFWRQVTDGVALFLTRSSIQAYRLPLQFSEMVTVSTHFHLKPLFPLIASNNRFFVLSLSQNDVRLMQGTHQSIGAVDARAVPSSLQDASPGVEDDAERELQNRTANRTPDGRTDQMYHGHPHDSDDNSRTVKPELQQFFRSVDEGVMKYLADEEVPLVVAGVSEYLPMYREVNSYAHLVEDEVVAGNPEDLRPDELHQKAWSIVSPIFDRTQQEALDAFDQHYHQNGNLASGDFHEIVPACAYGRVDTLFVPIGEHRWGRFDPNTNTVELRGDQGPGDYDLLNYAAVHAYLNGATIYAMRPENMPNGQFIAATFRYPTDVTAKEQG
jgi:hypothetical protein